MRSAMTLDHGDLRFDLPPHFAVVERRLSGQALDRWLAGGRQRVTGFADNSLVIADPFGAARVESVGTAVTATFGLAAGMVLGGKGLAGEIRAACDLIAIDPQPQPFEASLEAPGRACILVRGIALPIPGADPEIVQIVVNWRELLNRSATSRLRRELGAALRVLPPYTRADDPFRPEFAANAPR